MSKLLIDEYPLILSPRLATKLGLSEAIILAQIHQWTDNNKKWAIYRKDGFYWSRTTLADLHETLHFLSLSTIKRKISSLEKSGYLVAGLYNEDGSYNKEKTDRTKWYRINYRKVEQLIKR